MSPLPWAEPFAAALALRHEPGLVLLESLPGFGGLGRRSYLARGPPRWRRTGSRALDRLGDDWWAGWLSYDLGREIERLPDLGRDDLGLPSLALGRFEAWIEFDHERRTVAIRGDGDAAHLVSALRAGRTAAPAHAPVGEWRSSLPRPDYEAAVQRAIDYIRAGDIFQVNLSQRFGADWDGDPVRALRALAAREPGAVRGARAPRRRGRDLSLAGALPEPPRRARSRPARSRARARARPTPPPTAAWRWRCARARRTSPRT